MVRIVLPGEPLIDGPTALRPWRDSDLSAIAAACRNPQIARWTPIPVPYGEADARAFLLQRYDAIHAGSVALNRPEWAHARAEVGYWLGPAARGRGHATRAVRLISDWGFRTLGLERLDLRAAVENASSQRVAERAGYSRQGVLARTCGAATAARDMVAFSLLRPGRA